MGNKKVLVFNTVSQIIGKLLTAGITFFISLILARTYGASGYGDFTKITTYVAIFYLFADFGLNAAYLQEYSKDEDSFSSLLVLRVLCGLALIFISLCILSFLPASGNQGYTTVVKIGIMCFIPTILFQSLLTTANAEFQRLLRYDFSTYAIVGGSIISLVSILLSIHLFLPNVGIIASVLSLSLGSLVTAFIAFVLVKKQSPSLSLSWDPYTMKRLLFTAAPLGLTLLFNVIYFRVDSIILTLTRTTEEVGLYGFAYKIFEFPLVIPTFFMNALYPLLLQTQTLENRQIFLSRIQRSALALFLVSILFTIAGWIAAPLLSLVRPEFTQSIPLLRILLSGLPVFFLSALTMWSLVSLKKQSLLLVVYGISMIGNVSANIFLTPKFGAVAASWITVSSELLVLILSFLFLRKALKDGNRN